jgi:predicted HAD superfamily phosphohydrolase YqeG
MWLDRWWFTLQMGYRYRQALAKIYRTTPPQQQLCQLSPIKLKQQGITVIVLDFDGVLAAHGESLPAQEIHSWLQACIKCFGAQQVFVLSNKPLVSRIAYFNCHYQGVRYITAVRKKPYPDGLKTIMALTKQSSHQVMLIDDRLLTGVLAACLANVSVTYITYPYVQLSKRPLPEIFFMVLRSLERQLISLYSYFSYHH